MTPKKILRLAGLVFGAAVLIALANIYHLNGFINLPSETPQVSKTSTTQPTFTPKASETATLTPIPPTETATATIPVVVDGIILLTPNSFIPNQDGTLVWIKGYEIGADPNLSAIKKGQTYGYLNTDVEHHKDWVISTVSIYYPGAGAEATERAKNEPINEFPTCDRKGFRTCQLTKAQLLDGSYGRWAQKMFGDKDHLIKVVDIPSATQYENMKILQSSLKVWETDQLLGLITNDKYTGAGKYEDEVVAGSFDKNPQMFTDFKEFENSGNPKSIESENAIYEAVLPIH